MARTAYMVEIQTAGFGQTTKPPGWDVLGLTEKAADEMFAELVGKDFEDPPDDYKPTSLF